MDTSNIFISNTGMKQLQKIKNNKTGENIHWTTSLNTELPIYLTNTGLGSETPYSLNKSFQNSITKFKKRKCYLTYNEKKKKWDFLTFEKVGDMVENLVKGLIALGIPERSCYSVISYNRPEWNLAFWTAIESNCINVGIYMTNTSEEIEHIINDSESKVIFVENQEQYNKIKKIAKEKIKSLELIVYFDDIEKSEIGIKTISFLELQKIGLLYKNKKHIVLEKKRRSSNIKIGQCCVLVYTSGTTGKSKGVMLHHDNITFCYNNIPKEEIPENPRLLSYLPTSHVAGLFLDCAVSFNWGTSLYFADKNALKNSLPFFIKEVKPHLFLGVPRVYEKIKLKIEEEVGKSNFLRRAIFSWARDQGKKETLKQYEKKDMSWKFKLANRIFLKLKKKIGLEDTKEYISGAAPLDEKIRNFFISINIYINNVYGLSENVCGSGLLPHEKKYYYSKSCGRPYMKNTVKIDPLTKEIKLKGRGLFMGYLNNPKKTQSVLDSDFYFKTGDQGILNKTNNLFIIGRIKELIITAGGENIAPVPIENLILQKIGQFCSFAVVIGNNRKYLTLLITIKNANSPMEVPIDEIEPNAKFFLQQKNIDCDFISELLLTTNFVKLQRLVEEAIYYANSHSVSNASKIKKWVLLERDFSLPTGELTPTMKLKRNKVGLHFKKEIDSMYLEPSL